MTKIAGASDFKAECSCAGLGIIRTTILFHKNKHGIGAVFVRHKCVCGRFCGDQVLEKGPDVLSANMHSYV